MSSPAVAIAGVARRFGRRWVLRGIDLDIQPGQVVALTGRNGSGKTTLLRLIASVLRPTRGDIRVFGYHTIQEGGSVRPLVGMLAHNAGIYDDLTAAENLVFSLRMAGQSARSAPIAATLERVGLGSFASERVRGFSAGMRRRLGLARLLLRPPRLLLLDEPYASFDQDGIELVNEFAAHIRTQGGAVILSTHDLARAAGVADHRAHIADGLLTEEPLAGRAGPAGEPA